jgi:hypothetical protein
MLIEANSVIPHQIKFAILVHRLSFFLINQTTNYVRFGSILSMGYDPGSEFDINIKSISTALIGNLISPGRGILIFFPLSVLSWIGLRRLFNTDRWLAWVFTGFIFGSLVLYSTWNDWGAGLSWGPRFFIPLLPYLTILAFLGFDALEKYPKFIRAALFGILILIGAMIALKGLMFNFLGFYGTLNLSPQVITQGTKFPATIFTIIDWLGTLPYPEITISTGSKIRIFSRATAAH